jgi:hypothetical protein
LLKSDALKLQLDPAQIMQTGQSHGAGIRDKPPLPALSYSFSLIRAANYNQYLVHNLQELRTALHGYISSADLRKLEEAIIQALLPVPETSGFAAITHHQADLRSNSPLFKKALACALRDGWGLEVSNIDLVLTIAPIDETDYKAISNLETLGLNSDDAHMAIQSALLAVGNVNSRIEDMKDYGLCAGICEKARLARGLRISGCRRRSARFSETLRAAHYDQRLLALRVPPAKWRLSDAPHGRLLTVMSSFYEGC